jgi:ribosomal protein S11
VTITPAAARRCCTAKASTGVGSTRGISRASKPAAAKIAAESRAKSVEP